MPASRGWSAARASDGKRLEVNAYWYRRDFGQSNFGDKLSPEIVASLSNGRVRYAEHGCRLLALGSILGSATAGDMVWGSGFLHATDRCSSQIRVSAVRGPLSRKRLLSLGVKCPEVYGDPAILLPWLLPFHRTESDVIGILPHYVDAAWTRRNFRDPRFEVIDVLGPIRQTVAAINRCCVLLSSSLHGCIAGEAYGVPTAWIRISDSVLGSGFKFQDYYASTRRDPVCSDWRRQPSVDQAVKMALATRPTLPDPNRLLRVFPSLAPEITSVADLTATGKLQIVSAP